MTNETRALRTPGVRPRPYPTALFILGSAAIHFSVAPMHFQEYVPFGLFFVSAGIGQVALALGILTVPARRLFLAGAAGTGALIALWFVSRTIGLPIGPHPGRPEAIGFSDIACVVLELVSTLLLVRAAFRRPKSRRRGPVRIALTTAPAVLLTTILTAVGVGSAINDMPYAFNASPIVPGQAATNLALLTEAPGSEPVKTFTLTARVTRIKGQDAWTYNGTVPGPVLRVTQGDRLRVTLHNRLPASTTIHWHGVPGLPDAEDGVAGITQQAVTPGHSMTYEFVAREPGTYWYHSHQDTSSQIGRGLFGALVVEPKGGPTESRDYTVVLHGAVDVSAVAINGTTGDLHLDARPGDTVRLRIVNAFAPGMDGGAETPVLLGAPYRVVALDGRDLVQPQVLPAERLPLGMGQRADVVFTMPTSGAVRLVDAAEKGEAAFSIPTTRPATVTVGDGPAPGAVDVGRLPLFDLTRYGQGGADPVAAAHADATYPIVLEAQGGFHDGRIELVHTINGRPSPYVPPLNVREGQVIRLHIVNRTPEFHPMHLHGHTLSVLRKDGRPIEGSPVHLDTILVGPHETWDVAFAADNPGIWMLHCHVLLHASFGMSMTVNYAGISSPYEMGSRSGNVPE
ncbi:MAG TPA: multicopper oxidase family protein [Candidatus Dormibacteraeota bacterium]|nr:multicopper oxidase family protein [Candidatus Dormibacteraeota bacterium]